ncbi:MAG: phosphotransferase [Bacteroidota bacterium]
MKRIEALIEREYEVKDVRMEAVLQEKGGRSVYKITSDRGEFVYKSANAAKSLEEIQKDLYIFDFAQENGFEHLPEIIKTRDGFNFARGPQGYGHLMSFIDGGEPADTAENWAGIGAITAKFHSLSDYPYTSSFTPESENETYPEVAKSLSFGGEYMTLANQLPDFQQCSQSLIHTDIGLHNIAQDRKGTLYFLDWDGVGLGITILDLGFPLLSQFLNDKLFFRKELAVAFYRTYFQHRHLPTVDKELIFDASLFFQLIYLPYDDVEKNWQKIQFAVKHKADLIAVIQGF